MEELHRLKRALAALLTFAAERARTTDRRPRPGKVVLTRVSDLPTKTQL